MANILRRVAILGGARIPFARANGAYAEASNQDMLTAAMTALVDKFALKKPEARRGRGRRGDQAFARLEPGARVRRSAAGCTRRRRPTTCSAPAAPASRRWRSSRNRIALGEIDCGHRRRRRQRERHPARPTARSCSASCLESARARSFGEQALDPGCAAAAGPRSRRRRASPSRAPACRWASTARRWRRSGRSGAASRTSSRSPATRTPRRRGSGLLRRSGRCRSRICSADNNVRGDTSLEKLGSLKHRVRPAPGRHAHRRQQLAAHRRRGVRAARVGRLGASHETFQCRRISRSPRPRRSTSSAWPGRRRAC